MSKQTKGSVPTMENPPAPPEIKEKSYPTKPNKEGFYYATEEEEEIGVLTKDYDNGQKIKSATLSNGRKAIIRQLKGRETQEAKRMSEGNKDKDVDMQVTSLSMAVTFDEKREPPEYYLDDLYQMDFVKLMGACNMLNF